MKRKTESMVTELVKLTARIKADQAKADELKKELLDRVGDADGVYIFGESVLTVKTITQARVDTPAMKRDHPDLVGQYLKKCSYRAVSAAQAVTA